MFLLSLENELVEMVLLQ